MQALRSNSRRYRDHFHQWLAVSVCGILTWIPCLSGCSSGKFWHEFQALPPINVERASFEQRPDDKYPVTQVRYQEPTTWVTVGQLRDECESLYATAVQSYSEGDFDGATNDSLQAAICSWKWINVHADVPPGSEVDTEAGSVSSIPPKRAVGIYHSSIALLINSAQRCGRLKPTQGIWLDAPDGPQLLRINYHGFAWRPQDFTQWQPVGEYKSERITRIHRRKGWGVPLVIIRRPPARERFIHDQIPFSATALLRPTPPDWEVAEAKLSNELPFALELFEPRSIYSIDGRGGASAPLAADITAPFAWSDNNAPRRWLDEFRRPDESGNESRLSMYEPYQPGKIPVIMVHGLLSEPMAWLGLANDLMADPLFTERYQLWAFRYPTGKPFLATGGDLRRELTELTTRLSEHYGDPALNEIVLIGHSMGGLVSKLQITESEERLWRAFANLPIDQLNATDKARGELQQIFFFRPVPNVRRAIFIGTPHDGSGLASTSVARLGINQVRRSPELRAEYDRFINDNPGAINPQFTKRAPTSVDLLQPDNDLLRAMRHLPINPHVSIHTIAGINHKVPFAGDGDGVVPLPSARHPGSETELLVDAKHQRMHSHPDTVKEVMGILRMHALSVSQTPPISPELDWSPRPSEPLLSPPVSTEPALESITGN